MLGSLRKHQLGGPELVARKKPAYEEARAQADFVAWCRARSDVLVMGLENAGKRSMAQVSRAKKLGMTGGAPDLIIATGRGVVFVEMKAENGRLRPDQIEVHRVLRAMGHVVLVCYGFDDGQRQLSRFLESGEYV